MMLDYLAEVRIESQRFAAALETTDPAASVPCCPDWDADDLIWHLTEVQDFWGAMVEVLAAHYDGVERMTRPAEGPLLPLFRQASDRLVRVLGQRQPEDECWTWSDDHTVSFVRRRQAHEALIHRVDAEQTAGVRLSPIAADFAADGVDEILNVMIAGIPDWGRFELDGASLRVEAIDAGGRWDLVFGRFTGTSPSSGNVYDTDALEVGSVGSPQALVRGRAADLDLWLWGRGSLEGIDVTGDGALADRLRRMAIEDTQ